MNIALLPLLLTVPIAAHDVPKKPPLRIFILAGQSNMEGPANVEELETLAPELIEPREDVWCVYEGRPSGSLKPGFGFRSGNFGPELVFGHVVGDVLEEDVLIIKSGIGGTTLSGDWRPPSAVKRAGGEVGLLYRHLIVRVHNLLLHLDEVDPRYERQGFVLGGFLWLQGESDAPPDRAPHYEANFTDFVNDVRADLGVPDLPVIIAQINDSGAWDDGDNQGPVVRAAQVAVAEKLPHCAIFATLDLDPGYHYDTPSFLKIGDRFAAATLPFQAARQEPENLVAILRAGARFTERELAPLDPPPDAAALAKGLHAYWTFDEGTGTTTMESIRPRREGELRGGTTWTDGLRGGAVRCADGQTVVFPRYRDPVHRDGWIEAMTISFWIRTPLKGGGTHLEKYDDGTEVGWEVRNRANESWAEFEFGDGQWHARGTWGDALMHGDGYEWHHVVCVYDLEQGIVGTWTDARPMSERSEWLPPNGISEATGPMVLGGALHGPDNFCAFDELAIWSRALSGDEVKALYNNGNGVELTRLYGGRR